MSEHKPSLVRAERRAVLFEECSHDEATTELTEDHRSFGVIIDRGGDVRYNDWLDTEENRKYVADSNGELYYCRVAEVKGPGLPDSQGIQDVKSAAFQVVNPDGDVVEFSLGDSLEIYQSPMTGGIFVKKVVR